jgi:hypothetical protein
MEIASGINGNQEQIYGISEESLHSFQKRSTCKA